MRQSTQKVADIEEAELAADKRKVARGTGFSMMEIRDRGWSRFKNGVVMEWHVDPSKYREGVAYTHIPAGHFVLSIKDQRILFDVDDFQKFLRWC